MSRKFYFCCVVTITFVLVLVSGYLAMLTSVGNIGDKKIRLYDLCNMALDNKEELLNKRADDMAFEKLCQKLEITVKEDEVRHEAESIKTQFPNLDQNKLLDICEESILRQKAIDKLSAEIKITAELAREYYESNALKYGEAEPEFEEIKHDMQMEMGEKEYEKELAEIRSGYEVKVTQ